MPSAEGLTMSERKERCGTCRFWDPTWGGEKNEDGGEGDGDCRRNPPAIPATSQQQEESIRCHGDGYEGLFTGWWPTTFARQWCGEWRAKPKDKDGQSKAKVREDDPIRRLFDGLDAAPGLVTRIRKRLRYNGIDTVEDLLQRTEDDLLEFRNFGETCMACLRRALNAKSLRLCGDR